MEIITSPYSNSAIHYYHLNSSTKNHIRCKMKTTFNLNYHITSSKIPVQIQLPLPKPKHKQLQKPNNSTSDVLRLMDSLCLPIPIDIYTSLLKECTETRDLARAIELHEHMVRRGIRFGLPLHNRLLLMYGSCGFMKSARQVFDKMPVKDSNSWAAMIAGYMDNGEYSEAVNLFVEMQKRHYGNKNMLLFPYSWILVSILKACVHTLDFEMGRQIHGLLTKLGYGTDLFISSSLINFYGKSGCLEGADFVFDQLSRRNTVVWTARIVNKCREERYDEVFNVYREMGREGVKRNSFTFSSVLKACGRIGDGGHCGGQVHANAIKYGLVSKSYVQCGLVDMYGKVGLIKNAKRVFEMNGEGRNSACWNAMLRGYIKHGYYVDAIKVLYEMKAADQQPQESLLNEVRSACGNGGLENKNIGIYT